MAILYRLSPYLIGAAFGIPFGLILRSLLLEFLTKLNFRNRYYNILVRLFVYLLIAVTVTMILDYLRSLFNIPSEYTSGLLGGTMGISYMTEKQKPNSKASSPRFRKIKHYEDIGMAIYNSLLISRPGISLEETIPIVRSITNLKWFFKLNEEQILNLKDKILARVTAGKFNENELKRIVSEFQWEQSTR